MTITTDKERQQMSPKPFPWKFYLILGLFLMVLFLWASGDINEKLTTEHRELIKSQAKQIKSLEKKADDRKELADVFHTVWLEGFDTGYDAAIEELDCVSRINVTTIGGMN